MENTGIQKEVTKSAISVSRVYESEYQKANTLTAELKQSITTVSKYPETPIVSSLQDNIFSVTDFAFENKEFTNTEVRVAWIDIPAGLTEAQVIERLSGFTSANLYRILSNHPILSEQQQHAIASPDYPEATLEGIANSQAVRYPKGHEEEGKLALDKNGKIQYRAVFFASKGAEDQDLRTSTPEDMYVSPELEAEMLGGVHVVKDQEL